MNHRDEIAAHDRESSVWQRFCRSRPALMAGVCMCGIVAASVLAPLVVQHSPETIDLERIWSAPSAGHWFGTDELGRDVFSRLLHGGRISLFVGFAAMAIAITVGTCLGAIAGYFGKMVDAGIMRLVDVMMAIPTLFLLLLTVTFLGASLPTICFLIGVTSWPPITRLVRSSILSLRSREFVLALRAVGLRDRAILTRHLLPNALDPILVAAAVGMGQAIVVESVLGFLGMGIQPPTPTWGNMLQNAQVHMFEAPWIAIFPGCMIFLSVLCLNLVAEGLRDALDVRTPI